MEGTNYMEDFNRLPESSNNCLVPSDGKHYAGSTIDERKQRRMISNRESARRSRMRKQRHLDELWAQVAWLRKENSELMEKLNSVCESHERVVQENAVLKEEVSELKLIINGFQISSSCYFGDIECLDQSLKT